MRPIKSPAPNLKQGDFFNAIKVLELFAELVNNINERNINEKICFCIYNNDIIFIEYQSDFEYDDQDEVTFYETSLLKIKLYTIKQKTNLYNVDKIKKTILSILETESIHKNITYSQNATLDEKLRVHLFDEEVDLKYVNFENLIKIIDYNDIPE